MPNIKRWIDERHREVTETGKTTLPFFNHKLYIGRPKDMYSGELRQSVNYPIQSVSSSFCAYQMYLTYRECQRYGINIYPNSFIHDSIIAEIPVSKIFEYLEIVKHYYIDFPFNNLGIPDGTDFEIGIGNFKKCEITYDVKDNIAEFKLGIKSMYNELKLLDLMKTELTKCNITNIDHKDKVMIKTLDMFNSKCSYNFIAGKPIDILQVTGNCKINSIDKFII